MVLLRTLPEWRHIFCPRVLFLPGICVRERQSLSFLSGNIVYFGLTIVKISRHMKWIWCQMPLQISLSNFYFSVGFYHETEA